MSGIVDLATARKDRKPEKDIEVDRRGKATVRSFDSLGALFKPPPDTAPSEYVAPDVDPA